MISTDDRLSLYLSPWCGFCLRVLNVIHRLGVEVEERNILEEPEHLRALVAARGRRTVPVLRIDRASGETEWVPESRDIIRLLEASFSDSGARRRWWRMG